MTLTLAQVFLPTTSPNALPHCFYTCTQNNLRRKYYGSLIFLAVKLCEFRPESSRVDATEGALCFYLGFTILSFSPVETSHRLISSLLSLPKLMAELI